MTKRKEHIEQEIEQTMAMLGQSQRLPANPWFATRVRTHLTTATDPQAHPIGLLVFRRWRPALLALIVMLNLVTAAVAFQRSEPSDETRQTYMSNFASEYAYTTTDMLFTSDEP